MSASTDWLHTGETENGLQIWAREDVYNGERYLFVEYRNSEGERVGSTQDYPISQIRLLNAVLESLDMEYGVRDLGEELK